MSGTTDPLAGIVPRWEWRTFGESANAAEGRLALLDPERIAESDELYMLSLQSDASVKVRDGLVDVKRLEAVDRNGLEQWRPVLKATFPLSPEDVSAVLTELGVPEQEVASDAYTLERLISET